MKKLYTFMVVLGCASASFGQGYDLELTLDTPVSGAIVGASASVSVEFTIVNNGPTTIPTGDTLWVAYGQGTSQIFSMANVPGQASGFILNSDLASGTGGTFGPFTLDLSSFVDGDTVIVICFGVNGAALTAAGDPNETNLLNNGDNFFIGQTSGLSELSAEIVVFPNPAADVLNVKTTEAIRSITVLGLDGKVVAEGENSNSIDVSSLNSGQYIYRVETASGALITNMFVKQ